MKPALLLLALALAATAAQAQNPDAVIGRIPRGTRVRVELRDSRRVSGWLGGVSSSGITLTSDRDSTTGTDVAFADMRRLWERKRAVRPGAIIGAAAGALAGAFLGLLGNAMCETTSCGSPASDAALGAVLVTPLGAGVGAIIGAAIPRWKTTWHSGSTTTGPVSTTTVAEAAPPARRHIGEFTIAAVGGAGRHPGDGFQVGPTSGAMGGLAASFGFRAGRFAFGPEMMRLFGPLRVSSFSGIARVDLSKDAPLTPYVVTGLGGYTYRTTQIETTQLTLPLGAGVTTASGWRFEARWEPVVQNADLGGRPTLFTVRAGYRLRW